MHLHILTSIAELSLAALFVNEKYWNILLLELEEPVCTQPTTDIISNNSIMKVKCKGDKKCQI